MSQEARHEKDGVTQRPGRVEVSPDWRKASVYGLHGCGLTRGHALQQRSNAKAAVLHGTLFVTIHESRSLPGDPTRVSVRKSYECADIAQSIANLRGPSTHEACLPQCCPGFVNNVIVVGEKTASGKTRPPHPYCVMTVGGVKSAYTSVAESSFGPQWEERVRVPVASHAAAVQFTVKVLLCAPRPCDKHALVLCVSCRCRRQWN